MIALIFYALLAYGIAIAIKPLIDIMLLFNRDTWDKHQEWDKKKIKNWMDAYHRGTPGGNYEYYDSDKPTWDEDLMKADYDKYDDPFYIGDDDEKA